MIIPRKSRRAGTALILVLWALLLLSAMVFGWARFIDREITLTHEANLGLEARVLAESGVAVALHPQVSPQTPILDEEIAPGRRYHVELTGEGGKLNVSWIIAGEEPAKLAIFKKYLERRGLDLQEREVFLDAMLDWVDPDSDTHLNGAEDGPDYHPPNRALLALSELTQIRGSEPLVSQAGWEDELTILSQAQVDLASAPVAILRILPGIGDATAQRFVELRQGPDLLDGTADDRPFRDLNEIRGFLGLSEQQFQALAPYVTFNDPTWRIRSVGEAGDVIRQLDVVARKAGAKPVILSWKES